MGLFQKGSFVLNSGATSRWKLECDALTDDDVECLAFLISNMVGPFSSVEGVPRGGVRLASALNRMLESQGPVRAGPHLIVDDVLTTGRSMEVARAMHVVLTGKTDAVGAVLFARDHVEPSPWIRPVFNINRRLWGFR